MRKKNITKIIKGFTLIEMLLVIAIIGILAAVVFAMIGNSDNSKRKAALSTARSVLTYVQECYFNKNTLNAPTDDDNKGTDSGDIICDDTITEWPELSVEECSYNITGDYTYEVQCGGGIGNIECDAENGTCVEDY